MRTIELQKKWEKRVREFAKEYNRGVLTGNLALARENVVKLIRLTTSVEEKEKYDAFGAIEYVDFSELNRIECPDCKKYVKQGLTFCPECGYRIPKFLRYRVDDEVDIFRHTYGRL